MGWVVFWGEESWCCRLTLVGVVFRVLRFYRGGLSMLVCFSMLQYGAGDKVSLLNSICFEVARLCESILVYVMCLKCCQ